MKKATTLYENKDHSWQVIARDPALPSHLIDTNEYLISSGGQSMLTDPGGQEIFPAVFSALSAASDPRKLTHIFASHQDPDVISSLALWLDFKPELKCYTSWLWCSFIPHFGGFSDTFIPVADSGGKIEFGGRVLQIVAAHYLHSSGNHHLYYPTAKILFSGDIGAALLPPVTPNYSSPTSIATCASRKGSTSAGWVRATRVTRGASARPSSTSR